VELTGVEKKKRIWDEVIARHSAKNTGAGRGARGKEKALESKLFAWNQV